MSFANVFLGKIATDVSVAKSQANTAEGTRDMFQNAVQELSGVSMDEEMTEMMSIQRSYQAAAKLMKTIDDMLDVALTLI
jgi:flagellar hook-associated protein 1 FlgK